MPWTYAGSRLAVALRRWRGRFGIYAPRVAVRMHVPLRLRAFGVVVMLVALVGVVFWTLDSGRLLVNPDRNRIQAMQANQVALEAEVARLRGLLAASENDLQIEKAALKQLTDKYSALLEENARLKEEIAVLERIAKTRKQSTR